MNIHILYSFHQGAWGGGNQFLSVLRDFFDREGIYTHNVLYADVILVNSYQEIAQAIFLKYRYPHKRFIHRLGPIFFYHRGKEWRMMDKLLIAFANNIADGVIFQSQWSYNESMELGFLRNNYKIISNAVDKNIFYQKKNTKLVSEKIQLIAISWSSNMNKGFEFLQYLDDYLDFTKYGMKFIGNSPIVFKNIHIIPPQSSSGVAEQLRSSDIYISAARFEACSNAILEAIACGLPVVALNSGGNSEVVKDGGELFVTKEELVDKIDKIAYNYKKYQEVLSSTDLNVIGEQYSVFIEEVVRAPVRQVSGITLLSLYLRYYILKFYFEILFRFKKPHTG